MLNNVLGGPAMSSRLGLNIREKYGFAYSIESQYTAYSDVGLINVYMGVDPDSLERAIDLVHKELDKLCTQELGTLQLHHAKQQLIGQVALSYESGMNELLSATRSLIMVSLSSIWTTSFKKWKQSPQAISLKWLIACLKKGI